MSSEKIIRYLEIALYLIVLGSMVIGSEVSPRVKFFYYGMKGTSALQDRTRRLNLYFMENYFNEVHQ